MFTAYQLVSTSITLVIIKENEHLNIGFKLIIRYENVYVYVHIFMYVFIYYDNVDIYV